MDDPFTGPCPWLPRTGSVEMSGKRKAASRAGDACRQGQKTSVSSRRDGYRRSPVRKCPVLSCPCPVPDAHAHARGREQVRYLAGGSMKGMPDLLEEPGSPSTTPGVIHILALRGHGFTVESAALSRLRILAAGGVAELSLFLR